MNYTLSVDVDAYHHSAVMFEKNLSEKISSIDLLFADETGLMNGDFCLVYSIHEEVYRLVEAKETKTNFDTPISLFIDCYRSGIHFEFTLEDVQNVDSIF